MSLLRHGLLTPVWKTRKRYDDCRRKYHSRFCEPGATLSIDVAKRKCAFAELRRSVVSSDHLIKMTRPVLAFICVTVCCIIAALGLWPFHAPDNEVSWLSHRDGLRLGAFNTVASSGSFPRATSTGRREAGLDIWLQPARIWESHTFLAFSTSKHPFQFSLRQHQLGLELESESQRGAKEVRMRIEHVFRQVDPAFVTLMFGQNGVTAYVDGLPTLTVPQLRIPTDALAGRLVIGDSPGQGDSWAGQVLGLAVYQRELSPPQVLDNYRKWTTTGAPSTDAQKCALALYLFDEHRDNIVHNKILSNPNLYLYFPKTYQVMDKLTLQPPWSEFSMTLSYWSAVIKNIVGFIPLGFCLYAYFSTISLKRALLITVALGSVISLTIEILQAYLPTRDSGMTDVITNTLGTWLGASLYALIRSNLPRFKS
jgi:VanZ family protein